MSSCDFTPDDSDLLTGGGSVNVGDSLTQVEFGFFWCQDVFDLDQRNVWVVDTL